ncbi:DinB family protein [Streptomyces odontomachi]|uniref:DinB family protein n=1 Tax=Streptomyces odontomachi TaxID=2944940 RepID=UPI00210A0133|nr:DinB family protein [Streptomyces sp. ODS25]
MATLPDGRPIPPLHADERAMLETWLDYHRETLALKCADLTDDQLRTASVAPSDLTLLGLVQHMAEVERNWFQRIFAGLDVPRLYGMNPHDGFQVSAAHGLDEALASWRAEIDRARELTADAALDDSGRFSEEDAALVGSPTVSLRWILVHLIEEYARHNGHADLIREAIDGVTGS